jgi:hypothetical protein
MEVAGVVIGGVGLAALFETCMSTFEYVDTGKKYGKLELRLSRWGQHVRFLEDITGNSIVATAHQSSQVEGLLGQIQMDLEDACKASRRYVLPRPGEATPEEKGSVRLESLADKFRYLALQRQERTPILTKTRWALRDKKKLCSLISDIRTSVESLEVLFPMTEPQSKQERQAVVEDVRQLLEPSEVEEPEEDAEPIVSVLQQVSANVDDQLREAVDISARHAASGDTFRNITTSNEARVELGDFVATGYNGPAPTEKRTNRIVDGLTTSDKARVRVGNTYGGKGVFDD